MVGDLVSFNDNQAGNYWDFLIAPEHFISFSVDQGDIIFLHISAVLNSWS